MKNDQERLKITRRNGKEDISGRADNLPTDTEEQESRICSGSSEYLDEAGKKCLGSMCSRSCAVDCLSSIQYLILLHHQSPPQLYPWLQGAILTPAEWESLQDLGKSEPSQHLCSSPTEAFPASYRTCKNSSFVLTWRAEVYYVGSSYSQPSGDWGTQ